MVTVTVNYAAGMYDFGDGTAITKIVQQTPPGGATDYFFTSTNIYNATMFAVHNPGGWLGTLFYGRTAIDANGLVTFVPDAQASGSVGGVSADAFAADYVAQHGTNLGLTDALLAGDDTLIGNGRAGSLDGGAGDDLIVGGGVVLGGSGYAFTAEGGSGDDVIHGTGGNGSTVFALGGKGDDFIFMSEASVQAKGGAGADTYFFNQLVNLYRGVEDFAKNDSIQLDPGAFSSLASGFSRENFRVGTAAHDANDYLILTQFGSGHSAFYDLYYDPDGNGSQSMIDLGRFNGVAPTWRSIVVSADIPTAGDQSAAGHHGHHDLASIVPLHVDHYAAALIP